MAASPYITQLRAHRDEAASFLRAVLREGEASGRRDLSPADNEKMQKATEVYDRFTAEIDRHEALYTSMGATVVAQYAALQPALLASRGLVSTGTLHEARDLRRLITDASRIGGGGSIDTYLSAPFTESRAIGDAIGTTVPSTFADFLVEYQRTTNPMFNPAVTSFLNDSTGRPVVVPRLTADVNPGGTVTAEAGGITESDATFSAATLTPWKFGVTQIYSSELAEDHAPGIPLEQTLAENAGRALGINIGTLLTTGTGTVQPWGVVTRATNGGTALGTASGASSWTFFGPPDLATLYMSLSAPYRSRGTFMVSTTAYTKILAWRDSQNNPILIPGFAGQPSTIFGRPIVENPAMAAAASASKSVLFGDFSRYYVAHRDPVRVDFSNAYKFSTDQWACRVIERVDGDLVDAAAVAYLVSANV